MPGVERGPKSYPQTRGKRLYKERTILLAKERGRSRSRNQTRRSWASKGRRGRGAHSPSPPSLILSSPVGWKGSFFTSIPPPPPHSQKGFDVQVEPGTSDSHQPPSSGGWTRRAGRRGSQKGVGSCAALGWVPGVSGSRRRLGLG